MVDFSRMNGSSFERLVRAIAFDIFGAGGTVYSSGPDGGRDFTFDGKIRSYESQGWAGYLVVQSKFKESSGGGDAEWLIGQLEKDWENIRENSGVIRLPEYYLVATNVKLSGSDGQLRGGKQRTGGHTKVSAWLQKLVDSGEITGFDIWSGDKIADLLAARPPIAQTFAAWTTPGDVLTQLLKGFEAQTPNFSELVRRSMKAELRRDQFARLKDAGSVENDEIPTSHVFVDLPVRRGSQDETSENAFQSIVELSKGVFRDERFESKGPISSAPSKIVLMGGPGQGKSTLTTFLVQFFRATILSEGGGEERDASVRSIIPEILKRAKSEGVNGEILKRYPVWISLPKYADMIAARREEGVRSPSLLAYIAASFSTTADQDVDREDLRRWLKVYPWLVVLDGLDEVPSSGERPAILEAIKAFESEIAEANGDVVLLVTTRPQGYNHDLNPKDWSHWNLQPLSPDQALRYAEELGKALHRDDVSRRNDVLVALREASSKPSTSRLMTNPLQVTILHMIVDTGGGVPPGRWNLFNSYYEVLKRREKAKGGEIRRAIERNWNWLGPIHQRVGLALHLESEVSGSANAYLTPEEFRKLVHDYLVSETLTATEAGIRADELCNLAIDRLVLLTAKEQGRIAFDVRSLQEFMAAAALTSTAPHLIQARLQSVAQASHWRNVFLIAASRCFDEDAFHWVRSSVIAIPRAIEGDAVQLYLRRGARLALDMFNDGLATEHPDFRRQLAVHALETLSLGPVGYDARLPRLYEPATSSVVMDTIRSAINGDGSRDKASAAWMMCFELSRTCADLLAMVEENIPVGEELGSILTRIDPPLPTRVIGNKIKDALLAGPPDNVIHPVQMYVRKEGAGKDENSLMLRSLAWPSSISGRGVELLGADQLMYHYSSISNSELSRVDCEPSSPWSIFSTLAELSRGLSAQSLAAFLKEISEDPSAYETTRRYAGYLPWPVEAIMSQITEFRDLRDFAERVEGGDYGDTSDWLLAEERWLTKGITVDDLKFAASSGQFFDGRVASIGMPLLEYISKQSSDNVKSSLDLLLNIATTSNSIFFKRSVAVAVAQVFDELHHEEFDRNLISQLLSLAAESSARLPYFFFHALTPEIWDDEALATELSVFATFGAFGYHPATSADGFTAWLDAYERRPAERGGIIILLYVTLYNSYADGFHQRIKRLNLTNYANDTSDVVVCKAILKALYQDDFDEQEFAAAAVAGGEITPFGTTFLLRDDVQPARAAKLAELIIHRLLQNEDSERIGHRHILTRVLDRVPAPMHAEAEWDRLELPKDVRRTLHVNRRIQ